MVMAKKAKQSAESDDAALVSKVYEWFQASESEDSEDRNLALEDSRFCDEEDGQWQEDVKRKRKGLPNYTFNKVAGAVDAVVGDWRQNRARIKVVGFEDGDVEAAEVRTGLIRQIENISDATTAYDIAFECSVGAFRVCTDYVSPDSFDQDILIQQIKNQFTVYWDPLAQTFSKSDGRYMIVCVDKPRKEFEKEYGDVADFSGIGVGTQQWVNEDSVRVAECWYKKPTKKTLLKLSDGSTQYEEDIAPILDELSAKGVTVKKSRDVVVDEIWCAKVGGNRVIEHKKWAGSLFPIVLVFGKSYVIDGKDRRRGIVRFAKDAQRSYNLQRSVAIERVALAPKAPYLVTEKMVEGHETQWANANLLPYPYLRYNPDPSAPGGKPAREPPADMPVANMQLAAMDADDIKSGTGQYDASLGARSNETSGRAIAMRERQGDVATFVYQDNMIKALKYCGQVIVDLIPKIYDGERVVRILGKDGGEKFVKINEQVLDVDTGNYITKNDMQSGKYDIVVDTGPNYATQRVEAADSMIRFAQAIPQSLPVIGDLLADAMDWPNKDQIAERLRATMPPNIVNAGVKGDDKIPPQAKAAIAQMQAEMQKMQQFIDQGMQQYQAMQAENEQIKSGAAVKAVELQLKGRELDLKESELQLKAQETEARIVESNAKASSLITDAETKEMTAAANVEKTIAEANSVRIDNVQAVQAMQDTQSAVMSAISQMAAMLQMQQSAMAELITSINKPKSAQVRLSDGRIIKMEQQ
jgi:hypothetical protein